MASLYRKRGIWHMSLMVNKKRITKSLRTRNYTTVKELKLLIETTILQQLNEFAKSNALLLLNRLLTVFLSEVTNG